MLVPAFGMTNNGNVSDRIPWASMPHFRKTFAALALIMCVGAPAFSQQPGAKPDSTLGLVSALVEIALQENMEPEYIDDSKWGQTKTVFDGVKITGGGFFPRISKRKKQANHGTWKRYTVQIHDPQNDLSVEVHDLKVVENAIAFQTRVVADVTAKAELQQWNRDLRILALVAEADTTIRADFDCRIRVDLTTENIVFTKATFTPQVASAQLELVKFKLRRIGDLHGPLVRELGEELDDILRKRLREKQEKVRSKAERILAKQLDDSKLHISPWKLLAEQIELPKSANPPAERTTDSTD